MRRQLYTEELEQSFHARCSFNTDRLFASVNLFRPFKDYEQSRVLSNQSGFDISPALRLRLSPSSKEGVHGERQWVCEKNTRLKVVGGNRFLSNDLQTKKEQRVFSLKYTL
jgi:hypothetical protein